MTSIIGLTGDDFNEKIMVNTDQIAYFKEHFKESGTKVTAITMANGDVLTVREDVYEIAYRIAPDPADIEPPDDDPETGIVSVTNRIISGTLTPGERVEIQSTVEYEDGQIRINRLAGTYADTRPSQFPGNEGVDYHYFSEGTLNGQPHASFGLPAEHFIPPP